MGSEKRGMGGPGHGPVPSGASGASEVGLRAHCGASGKGSPFQAHFPSACEAVGLGQWYSLEIKKIINANAQSLSPQRF